MQALRIGAKARSRIVREQLLVLGTQGGRERSTGRLPLGRGRLRPLEREPERLEDLRPRLAVARACSTQRFLDSAQRALVAVEQLDLDLREGVRHAFPVKDGHRVPHHLGTVDANALASRTEPRDRYEVTTAHERHEQLGQLDRGGVGSAFVLDLDPPCAVGQLQLPGTAAVLVPVSQRDAAPGKAMVGRVVVGRHEHAWLDRLATEVG